MKEYQRSGCAEKFPMLERFNLTGGIVGGILCQLASIVEALQKFDQTVNKTVYSKH